MRDLNLREVLVAGPAVEPVSLTELKANLRVDHTAEDAFLTSLIPAARQWVEEYTWSALNTQTWDLFLDCWPLAGHCDDRWYETYDGNRWAYGDGVSANSSKIDLPKGNIQSVAWVKYTDAAGAQQTLPTSAYEVVTGQFGYIRQAYGAFWPPLLNHEDSVQVRYVAGYGDAPTDVPQPVRLAIMQLAGYWWLNRMAISKDAPSIVTQLLGPYMSERLV